MKKLVKIRKRKKVEKDIGGPLTSSMSMDRVMEGMDEIEELKDGEYPQCPHGPWRCPYKTLWPMFKKFGDDYMGHTPTCTLCVQWAQVKQLIKIGNAVKLLRYSG